MPEASLNVQFLYHFIQLWRWKWSEKIISYKYFGFFKNYSS